MSMQIHICANTIEIYEYVYVLFHLLPSLTSLLKSNHEHVFITAGVNALYDSSTAKTSVRSTQSVHSDALIGWPMHTATEVAVFVAHVEVAGGNSRCQALLFGGLLG